MEINDEWYGYELKSLQGKKWQDKEGKQRRRRGLYVEWQYYDTWRSGGTEKGVTQKGGLRGKGKQNRVSFIWNWKGKGLISKFWMEPKTEI